MTVHPLAENALRALRGLGAPRGLLRFLRGAGLAAAVGCALFVALDHAPAWTDRVVQRMHMNRASSDVTFWTSDDPISGFVAYAMTLAIVLGGAGVYALVEHALGRWKWARAGLAGVAVVGFVAWTATGKGLPRGAALALFPLLAALMSGHYAGNGGRVRPTGPRSLLAFGLACEGLALAWGAWLVTIDGGPRDAMLGVFLALSLVGWRVRAVLEGDAGALAREVWTGAPFLVTPLLGLLRQPSPWLLFWLLVAGLALRVAADRRAIQPPEWLSAIAGPTALASIFIIPLSMRDIPTVSLKDHEAQHLGWINSALHGKFLMADAGTIYGPVREYLFTAWCLLFGKTLLQVRVAFVMANVVGLAIILGVAWRLVGRSVWMQVWCAFLTLIFSPVWTFLVWKSEVSLGWADLSRPAWSMLALVGALRAVFPLGEAPVARRSLIREAAWGASTVLATFYSQEYGLCAVAAVVVAAALHPILLRRGSWRARLRAAGLGPAVFLGGFVAGLALWLAVYGVAGKAGLFLHTIYEETALTASGAWGHIAFPLHADSFRNVDRLVNGSGLGGGLPGEYALPPAIYAIALAALVARAAAGRWSERATLVLAMTLFGAGVFRTAMHRSDVYHLISATPPAVVVAVALAADVVRFAVRDRGGRFAIPIGAAAVVLLILGSFRMSFAAHFHDRIVALVSGADAPSKGPKYVHPNIPRAGDVNVPKEMDDLITYVRAHSAPTDPIYCRITWMIGPEVYFLADRVDPTRYDMIHEMATREQQQEGLEDLKKWPPVLVVGASGVGCKECDDYLAQWSHTTTVGGVPVSTR